MKATISKWVFITAGSATVKDWGKLAYHSIEGGLNGLQIMEWILLCLLHKYIIMSYSER